MKINTLLTCLAICISNLLLAQIESTSKHFFTGGVNLTEGFHSIAASDGGYLIIGTQGFQNLSNTNDPWIIKLDEDENMEWEFLIDFAGEGFYDFGYRGIEVSDGYIILGSFADSTFHQLASLIKLDFDGNLLWSKVLDEFSETAYGSILLLDNDEFIIGGYRSKELFQGELSLTKFDTDGNEIWNKGYLEFNSLLPLWAFSDLAIAADGNFLLASRLNLTAHISKIKTDGEMIWTTDLATNGGGASVQALDDGDILVLSTLNYANNPSVDFLIRLDELGNIVNSHQFDFDLVQATSDTAIDEDENLYIVGNDFSNETGILLKTNTNGDTLWTQIFSAPDSIAGIIFQGIELTDDNQLLITGSGAVGLGSGLVVRHMHFMILTLEGEVVSTTTLPTAFNKNMFEVFPIPADDVVNFSSAIPSDEQWNVQLFDLSGKLILQQSF